MPNRTVKRVVDPARLPGLTGAQRADLAALRKMPEATIDTSDIPKLDDDFWARAVRNPLCQPSRPPPCASIRTCSCGVRQTAKG